MKFFLASASISMSPYISSSYFFFFLCLSLCGASTNDSCISYLTFRSHPPYCDTASIGSLLGSKPSEIARINNITTDEIIAKNTQILVPVDCSYTKPYCRSYVVATTNETFETVAQDTFQGLTTSWELTTQNAHDKISFCGNGSRFFCFGAHLCVPLTCKCPNIYQTRSGVSLLVSYVVARSDSISSISATFHVQEESIREINYLSPTDSIVPFSTIFIPIKSDPGKTQTSNLHESRGNGRNKVVTAAIVTGTLIMAAGTIIAVAMIVICCCLRKKPNAPVISKKRKRQNAKNVDAFLRYWGSFASQRYKYSDIKKITNSFENKIGQGGFGSVFKGKLANGVMVAVKVLSETKGNGNQFINEVASISRTSHVNIVTLLGFCVEGTKRALIYELMENGSLEKFIYDETQLKMHPRLKWETLYKIAIGIARGLEYLHRGCNMRIVHFDIKPHNILLDQDFTPKIADFGLSKLCRVDKSVVPMTRARGTAGYIAPEVVSRKPGSISDKSDVYSYGMMVLEMVGGRKNLDITATNFSEIYFPHWISKRLDLNEELGLHGITSLEDQVLAQKMILVSLWCIQNDPQNRPPMSRVLYMLEGSLETLQVPPKPF